ncbi:MAG: hypothetical protein KTR31_08540 [Myxococcales bacterium]|nr:hypothetical protein [Myxococcales bacterium]
MATDDALAGPGPVGRAVLSVVLLCHLLAMAGSLLTPTPLGPVVRTVSMPWEKVLGVHQNWPMFVTPPRTTRWIEVQGVRADGSRLPLNLLPPEPPRDAARWVYDRRGKLARNTVSSSRKRIRMAVVRWACRTQRQAADPIRQVALIRYGRVTPPPSEAAAAGPRTDWELQRKEFTTWNCPTAR